MTRVLLLLLKMSIRSLFVISLSDCKLLYFKVFSTVEKKWKNDHPLQPPLPKDQELLQLLLTELGLKFTNSFKCSRDSCTKQLQAPLFWIPYNSKTNFVFPVIIVESDNRLLCAVPYLQQLATGNEDKSHYSTETVIVLELLTNLMPLISLPVFQLSTQLTNIIQQYLPFGRANPSALPVELTKKNKSGPKGMWIKSKPKLEVHIKEDVRIVTSKSSGTKPADLFGTIHLSSCEEDSLADIKLNLSLPNAHKPVSVLFHSSVFSNHNGENNWLVSLKHLPKQPFPLCHYTLSYDGTPIQAVLKTRSNDLISTIFIQLKICPSLRGALTNLEVRFPLPDGNRILRILTAANQMIGLVSILRDGSQLVWNLSSMMATSKIKEEMTLNVEIETEKCSSLDNTYISVLFSAKGASLSGIQITQQSELKIIQSRGLRSSFYHVWNQESQK